MLVNFFLGLKEENIPLSLRELFDLLEALKRNIVFCSLDNFYYISRLCLVKDEKHFDKFDRAFSRYFQDLESFDDILSTMIPEQWLRKEFIKTLTKEEKEKINSLGGLEKLFEEFLQRMQEQKERHQGGSKWIGTGGTSAFGAYGFNPEGMRIGQDGKRNNRAVKVWDKRKFRDLDDNVEIGTRNIKLALRRLRKFARLGAADELDIDDTIFSTAKNAGFLALKMVPERHNAVKVLIFFEVGGSMDPHVKVCEELFSATRSEFKYMEYFYFHNFVYEFVWKKSERRRLESLSTFDILHKYGKDYKVIFVGDASMARYEITHVGGSVEHYNEESGAQWMQRFKDIYKNLIWINPTPQAYWDGTYSIGLVRELLDNKMYPLTVKGIETAVSQLS